MSNFKFTEREDYEQGFAQLYDTDIAPYLREKEGERLRAIERSKKWMYGVGFVTLILAVLAFRLEPLLAIFPIFFGGFAILFIPQPRRQSATRDHQCLAPYLVEFL